MPKIYFSLSVTELKLQITEFRLLAVGSHVWVLQPTRSREGVDWGPRRVFTLCSSAFLWASSHYLYTIAIS